MANRIGRLLAKLAKLHVLRTGRQPPACQCRCKCVDIREVDKHLSEIIEDVLNG